MLGRLKRVQAFVACVLAVILVLMLKVLIQVVFDLHLELFLLDDTGSREALGAAILRWVVVMIDCQVGCTILRMDLLRAASRGVGGVYVGLEIAARIRGESQGFLIGVGRCRSLVGIHVPQHAPVGSAQLRAELRAEF